MAIMKTLTVGSETYTVRDPEAVSFEQPQALNPMQQQTARGNIGAMSANEAADHLCPSFAHSGAVVACEPVEGYPLTVTTEENATKITRCGKNLFGGELFADRMVALGAVKDASAETVTYSGGDCNTTDPIFDTFKANTQYTFIMRGRNTVAGRKNSMNLIVKYTNGTYEYVSGVEYNTDETVVHVTFAGRTVASVNIVFASGGTLLYYDMFGIFEGVIESGDFEPFNGGTFAPGETITAIPGVNTIYADKGKVTVTGRADPVAIIQKLTNAIISLGGNI